MTTVRKVAPISFKAIDGPKGQGRFVARVAAFGNVDKVGDRIMPDAFTADLVRWQLSGNPIPMIFSHEWGDLDAHVGIFDPLLARETTEGLELTGEVDLSDPPAAKVFKLLSDRRVTSFSFAYDVIRERRAPDGANELMELALLEAGPCLVGCNPEARLLAVKTAVQARQRERVDMRASLEASFDPELVAALYGDDRATRAFEAELVRRSKALEVFVAANTALQTAGMIPGAAEEAARQADALARARAEEAVRAAERAQDSDEHERREQAHANQLRDETPAVFGGNRR